MNHCITCQKETANPKYCSRSCAAKHTNKEYPKRLRKAKCIKCDSITKSFKHNMCEKHWQEYQEQLVINFRSRPIKEYWQAKSLQDLPPSSKNAHIRGLARSWFKDLTKLPCAHCGYDKHVELCHIKPLASFTEEALLYEINSRENIIQLCPNCHWEFDNIKCSRG